MSDLINRSEMLALMERQADYDTHPKSCYRMIRAVRNFPAAHAVPADLFLDMLNSLATTQSEVTLWKQRAGLA